MKSLFLRKKIDPIVIKQMKVILKVMQLADYRPVTETLLKTRLYNLIIDPDYHDVLKAFGFDTLATPYSKYTYRPAVVSDLKEIFVRNQLIKFLTDNNPFRIMQTKSRVIGADLISAFRLTDESAFDLSFNRYNVAFQTVDRLMSTAYFNYLKHPEVSVEALELVKDLDYVQLVARGATAKPYERVQDLNRAEEAVLLIRDLISEDYFLSIGKDTLDLSKKYNRTYSSVVFGNSLAKRVPYYNVVYVQNFGAGVVKLHESPRYCNSLPRLESLFGALDERIQDYDLAEHVHSVATEDGVISASVANIFPQLTMTYMDSAHFMAAVFDLIEFTPSKMAQAIAGMTMQPIEEMVKLTMNSKTKESVQLMAYMSQIMLKTDLNLAVTVTIDKKINELLTDHYKIPDGVEELKMIVPSGQLVADFPISALFEYVSTYVVLSAPYAAINDVFYPRSTFFDGSGYYPGGHTSKLVAETITVAKFSVDVDLNIPATYEFVKDNNSTLLTAQRLARLSSVYNRASKEGREIMRIEVIQELKSLGAEIINEFSVPLFISGSSLDRQFMKTIYEIAHALYYIRNVTQLDYDEKFITDIKMSEFVRFITLM